MDERIELTLTPADQAASRYRPVPVEIPEGTISFEVRMTVDEEGTCVDLGCEDPLRWRGWSGGARTSFIIAENDATPGYEPGPLPTGRWNVILGLHRIPRPTRVILEMRSPATGQIDHGRIPEPAASVRGSSRNLPAPKGLTWYAGDLHAHTIHSDGKLSLDELAREAVLSGLDFLACTEHNTVSHHPHLAAVAARQGITLIPGQEITTHRGHANAFGDIGFIDFRQPVTSWAREVRDRGGLLSINHPVSDDCAWWHELPEGRIYAELFHATTYRALADTAQFAWCRLIGGVIAVGGADFHATDTPIRPGVPTTWIAARENTAEALLAGLGAGRVTVTGLASIDSDIARPSLLEAPILLREQERMRVLDASGYLLLDMRGREVLITTDDETHEAPTERGPYRLITSGRELHALCS